MRRITPTGDEVDGQDIQRWMIWLLDRYSGSYANNQYRAIQQFFKWWSNEEELQKLIRSCEGRTFIQRRGHAIISVFRVTGIRLSELAGVRYVPDGWTSPQMLRRYGASARSA
ncbi:MAG TPA: hypothetical protein VKS82_00945 [Streptosporangiaceae bacterium]|nr:hypothetical protein [Streptosporangiaceae bacterium]